MLDFLKQEANRTFTENGAVAYKSTESYCLDLFASMGALRHRSADEVIDLFTCAFIENEDIAMKLLFLARDVRGGLGERKLFRTLYNWLAFNEPTSVIKNMKYVAEFGRYDDLLVLMDTPCEPAMLVYLKELYVKDLEAMAKGQPISLLAKWLPSINASSEATRKNAQRIARAFGLKAKEYRQSLSELRAHIFLLENYLRIKDYSFAYDKQPSKALFKYRAAFIRNDNERYMDFIDKVSKGKAVMHADHVMPYELVDKCLSAITHRSTAKDEISVLNATWDALPNFGNNENALAVVDTSGSMYWSCSPMPISVALSLGLYFAERNEGVFKNYFIEFSARPELIQIKGKNFFEKVLYLSQFSQVANTNLEAVFDLILHTAIKHNVKQKDLPQKLIIISDMEFDSCVYDASSTVFENAKIQYQQAGYELPQVVFWKVEDRNGHQPVKMNEQGVALVSGVTPHIFEMVMGDIKNPYEVMMKVVESERYAMIRA